MGGGRGVDNIDGRGEWHVMAFQAGRMARGDTERGFAKPDAAEKNDVGPVFDELRTKQVLDLQAIDFFRPGPVELIQGFDQGQAGQFEAALNGTVLAVVGFTLHEGVRIMYVGPVVLGGLLRQVFEMGLGIRQFQIGRMARQVQFRSPVGWGEARTPTFAASIYRGSFLPPIYGPFSVSVDREGDGG